MGYCPSNGTQYSKKLFRSKHHFIWLPYKLADQTEVFVRKTSTCEMYYSFDAAEVKFFSCFMLLYYI